MSFELPNDSQFDQLALEKAVRSLNKTGVRRSPLTLERVRAWVNQFELEEEKSLAWLILRHLVYRTGPQLESSLRQALKNAATHFLMTSPNFSEANWKDLLAGKISALKVFCGPPVGEYTPPGKSGEVITRAVNRAYGVNKWYPQDARTLQDDERYLIVDDGAYTGEQLIRFLEGWRDSYLDGKVAIVVGLAHQKAVEALKHRYPEVPLFAGEILTEKNGLSHISDRWIQDKQWPYSESTPLSVYHSIYSRKGAFTTYAPDGFGSLGLMVAFEHGIPDDSLQLLWDKSASWTPLLER
ncbi:MAG: hypothetical protein ACK4FF_10515 [Limnobacter sp.]|uniref:phosphoribosyltransferase-like protein n=1 Tax=Limnobacter sp. TaxID=2003368 RepID=UPI00391A951F